MYSVSWGAVRRRRPQALMVFILAAIAVSAAAAGPWYGTTVASRAAGARVAAAPPAQHTIVVHRTTDVAGDPRGTLDTFANSVRALLALPGAEPRLGLAQEMSYPDPRRALMPAGLPVAYRDGFCDHVRLTGSCPDAAGEVAISTAAATRLKVATGDRLGVRGPTAVGAVPLRITATYQRSDPAGAYWADPLFLATGDLDPLFTTLDTFRRPQLARPTLAYDLEVPDSLLRGDAAYDLNGVLNAARPRFAAAQMELTNSTGPLADAVVDDRAAVAKGVAVMLGQLVVLAWFAIGLAGRFTGRDRRGDAGLLKLRGNSRSSVLRLAAGQHLVPMVAAVLAGWPIGVLTAWLLAGALPLRSETWPALLLSLGTVALVALGGLLVLTAVDAVAQRASVAALLRRLPSARRDWRSALVDLALVALAVGAVYQARTGGPDSGLGVVAPALVALAVGLLLARLLRAIADRAGGAAVRAGRLRVGLTAVQVSRQPGTDRVFALVVVGVALLALALGGYHAGRAERAGRSEIELGAARVLTVQAASRTRLEYAVRRADPGGRQAMAAVLDLGANPPVLAVDSSRLAAVATWRPEYGPVHTLPAATHAVRLPDPLPMITGTALTLRVASERAQPTDLGLQLQNEATGTAVKLEFDDIRRGEQTRTVPVRGCTVAPGCRLVRWQLFTPLDTAGRPLRGAVTLRSLAQQEPAAEILGPSRLADVTRWRTDYTGLAVQLSAGRGGLAMSAQNEPGTLGTGVYAVDGPLPLPVVLAGPPGAGWDVTDAAFDRFGQGATPVRVAGTPRVLPVLGAAGVLVDLDAARRLAADADLGGTYQVWLTADAPPALVDALRREGLTVVADRTAAGRSAALARQSSVVTAPFGLFTVTMAVLLTAAMVAVAAAVELQPQAEQLRALRVQGLARGTAATIGYAGTAGLVLAGLLGGLVAAMVAGPVAAVVAPPFADGWRVIPPPGALGAGALALAGAVALVVLGVTAWLSVLPLVRRVRRDER